jgi:hypothetical protein
MSRRQPSHPGRPAWLVGRRSGERAGPVPAGAYPMRAICGTSRRLTPSSAASGPRSGPRSWPTISPSRPSSRPDATHPRHPLQSNQPPATVSARVAQAQPQPAARRRHGAAAFTSITPSSPLDEGLQIGSGLVPTPSKQALLDLARNFLNIPDPRHQEAVAMLARALAERDDGGQRAA